jgi:hypothetical protein
MRPERAERRAGERTRRFFLCWFDGGHRDVEGFIQDVSDGGLFVRTAEPPAVGHKLTLLIQGPRRTTCEAYGEVQWSTLEPCGAAEPPERVATVSVLPDGPQASPPQAPPPQAPPPQAPREATSAATGFGFRVENAAELAAFIAHCDAMTAAGSGPSRA